MNMEIVMKPLVIMIYKWIENLYFYKFKIIPNIFFTLYLYFSGFMIILYSLNYKF